LVSECISFSKHLKLHIRLFCFDCFHICFPSLSKFLPSSTHLKYLHSAKSIVKYYSAKLPFVFLTVLYLSRSIVKRRCKSTVLQSARFPSNLFTSNNSKSFLLPDRDLSLSSSDSFLSLEKLARSARVSFDLMFEKNR